MTNNLRSLTDPRHSRAVPTTTPIYRVAKGKVAVGRTLRSRAGVRPGPEPSLTVAVQPCGHRDFIAALHDLADRIEHNEIEGPADWLALNEPDGEVA